MALKKTASSTIKNLYNKAVQNYSSKLAGNKSLLYNKYVLYVSFIICFINLLIWMFSGEFVHVAVFLLVGYLTSRFSKNMIVILVISLVVSNVFKSGSNIVLEGMESKESKESTEGNENQDDNEDGVSKGEGKKKEGMSKEGASKNKDDEDHEGIDESSYEGVDENETPCTTDKDCEKGQLCNSKLVCVAR